MHPMSEDFLAACDQLARLAGAIPERERASRLARKGCDPHDLQQMQESKWAARVAAHPARLRVLQEETMLSNQR